MSDLLHNYFIKGIIEDTDYNHIDLLAYAIILILAISPALKLLKKLEIEISERFVLATLPYVLIGSVYRVINDGNLIPAPVKYLFVSPLLHFLVFGLAIGALVIAKKSAKDYIGAYRNGGIAILAIGVILLLYKFPVAEPLALLEMAGIAIILTYGLLVLSPYLKMPYLKKKVYALALFAFLLDASSTYIGIDVLKGYHNKHPLSVMVADLFGSNLALFPVIGLLSVLLVYSIETEKETKEKKNMFILLLLALGFSMGVRNTIRIALGI